MKIIFKSKKLFIFRIKIELIFILFIINNVLFVIVHNITNNEKNIKIALCTMGKNENLYVNEFIEYYIRLGIDHIFIYDDNDPDTEKIKEAINEKYQFNVTVYETKLLNLNNQSETFSECYLKNNYKFDWFLMVDMDEFLYIVDDTLKGYLTKKIFNKCDFIKFHWVIPTDNDLIYYDSRPLFERFKPPYIKSEFIKSIVRGNIKNLKYWVHSPYIAPERNVSCTNVGKIIYRNDFDVESIQPINIKKAYIIHFRYKSTEEFVNKLKRGYSNWFGGRLESFLIGNIKYYLENNNANPEKIKFIENELNLNLSHYINITNIKNQPFFM